MEKVMFVCDHCGGKNVFKDAWAEWSIDRQEWVLRSVFDHLYCDDCEMEVEGITISL